jgi:hypothetical protein
MVTRALGHLGTYKLLKENPLMKLKLIGYWVATAFFAFNMLMAAIGELSASHGLVQIAVHEGYPVYLLMRTNLREKRDNNELAVR